MKRRIKCPADLNCQGDVKVQRITYRLKVGKKDISVPDVEVWVCDTCGEQFFPYESSKKIEA